jgi:hypothetical protein
MREKNHLDVGSMASHIMYYKGKGGDFPQVWGRGESCVFMLPMARPSTKGGPTMH